MSAQTATQGKVSKLDQIDIDELQKRIKDFYSGREDEERFKHFRLTRGVYGQRQLGVQMFRLKIPAGQITTEQIEGVADLADQYGSSNLHLTTRQNIQLHYVKLSDSPAVWEGLSKIGLTAREACGNTVRNITGSPTAGIQEGEAFDITPYVFAVFEYFLRNPICQEMGRKIKPAFSATEEDTAFTYFSDFGFIPKIQDGVRGFKLVVGGGLGAQSIEAQTVTNFIEANRIIPFMAASLRVFDRYGEREKRHKARMKFLVKSLGLEVFLDLVSQELSSLAEQVVEIEIPQEEIFIPQISSTIIPQDFDQSRFDNWIKTNTFQQKQEGYFGAYIRVSNGDIPSDQARELAKVIRKYASNDIRITIDQNLLLRHVHPDNLAPLFYELDKLGYGNCGHGSIADVTACPGTDTCNLGVTNSTALSQELEQLIIREYPELLFSKKLDIKISGCMNACGQHMAAAFGFHGSSIKRNELVIPAMQVIIGGGLDSQGVGHIGDKVIKLPTKRIPEAMRLLIADLRENKKENEEYVHYAKNQDRKYFYNLLKPLAELDDISEDDLKDWGQNASYIQEIGVGECAGVVTDMVGTILTEAEHKLHNAILSFQNGQYSDAMYHAYNVFIVSAKAMLLSEDIACNTQIKILDDFQTKFIDTGTFQTTIGDFTSHVLRIKETKPEEEFTREYIHDAQSFMQRVADIRYAKNDLGKEVVESYYKA